MPRLSRKTSRAVRKYGPSVNKLARSEYGISGKQLLARLDYGESSNNPHAVSSAGARGETQFMPETRQSFIKAYGIDPWRSPDEAIHAAALHLSGALGHGKGLEGYNPGSPTYTNYILGQHVELANGKGSHPSRKVRSTGGSQTVGGRRVKLPSTTITTPGVDNSVARKQALLNYFTSGQRHQPGGLLALVGTLQGLKDTPGAKETIGGGTVTTGFGGKRIKKTSGTGKIDGRGDLQLPRAFGVTHQTAGLPGYPARDIFGKPGEAVGAPVSGKVIKLSGSSPSRGAYEGQGGPFGWSVYIKGDNGHTYYLTHFGSRNVKIGQRVKRGQVIGTVGDYPGSSADHIHEGRH